MTFLRLPWRSRVKRLPRQGTRDPSLVQEDPPGRPQSSWARAATTMQRVLWSRGSARADAPAVKRPQTRMNSSPRSPQPEKSLQAAMKTQCSQKWANKQWPFQFQELETWLWIRVNESPALFTFHLVEIPGHSWLLMILCFCLLACFLQWVPGTCWVQVSRGDRWERNTGQGRGDGVSWNSQGMWTPRGDRNLQSLAAGTLPRYWQGHIQEKLTHLSCKEKKADDHGLDPTSTRLSLQRIFFFFNALVYQNFSFLPNAASLLHSFLHLSLFSALQSLTLTLLEHVRIQAQYNMLLQLFSILYINALSLVGPKRCLFVSRLLFRKRELSGRF